MKMILIINKLENHMSAIISLEHCQINNAFHIHFRNTHITICIHQLMNLLRDIYDNDRRLIDLGLFWSVQNNSFIEYDLKKMPTYRIYFGQTILLLSEREMVEFMGQIWDSNPMIMHWLSSEEQVCS